MAEARGQILDLMLAKFRWRYWSIIDLFINKEKYELVLQDDDIFCLDEESKGVKETSTVVFADVDNVQRINEETQVSIFNRLATERSGSTATDK